MAMQSTSPADEAGLEGRVFGRAKTAIHHGLGPALNQHQQAIRACVPSRMVILPATGEDHLPSPPLPYRKFATDRCHVFIGKVSGSRRSSRSRKDKAFDTPGLSRLASHMVQTGPLRDGFPWRRLHRTRSPSSARGIIPRPLKDSKPFGALSQARSKVRPIEPSTQQLARSQLLLRSGVLRSQTAVE